MFQKQKLAKLSLEVLKNKFSDKNVLIVGGTAGIGRALALSCLKHGAAVTIVGRRQPDSALAAAKFVACDLSLLRNAVKLSTLVDPSSFNIIVFTNGIITNPKRQESGEGIELDLAVSYLSRMTFLKESFSRLQKNESFKTRIFIMGYPGESIEPQLDDFNWEKSYKPFPAHMNTVVGNEALVSFVAEKAPQVNVFGLNPGLIRTEIRDNYLGKGSWSSWFVEGLIKTFCQSAEQYAENVLVHLLVSEVFEKDHNKSLFSNAGALIQSNPKLTAEVYQKVIQVSEETILKALDKKLE